MSGKRLSGQWQSWANASLVPTVSGHVTMRLTGCPGLPKAAGCVYTRQPRVVYLKPGLKHPRGVMLHELGHVYDLTVLSNRDRGQFRRIMRRPHAQWWKGNTPLAEWFAEAYAWCARYARIVSVSEYAIYRYDPTPTQHRDTCSLIKRAARDRTPPAPAPAPPVVTGDPTPPAPPPVTPAVVPGDPVRDPGPAPTENPVGDGVDADADRHAVTDGHARRRVPTVIPIPTVALPDADRRSHVDPCLGARDADARADGDPNRRPSPPRPPTPTPDRRHPRTRRTRSRPRSPRPSRPRPRTCTSVTRTDPARRVA